MTHTQQNDTQGHKPIRINGKQNPNKTDTPKKNETHTTKTHTQHKQNETRTIQTHNKTMARKQNKTQRHKQRHN